MDKRDYYDVLGINKTASEAEIKKAYRQKAKQYHPDVSKEENAEDKFKEVQEAYDVLGDSQKRAQYDRFGHASTQQGFGQGFGGFGSDDVDLGDIFSSFFGGGGGRTRQSANSPRKGQDMQRRMTVDFNDIVFGAKRKINVNVFDDCPECNGTGAKSKSDIKSCSRCHGTGTVTVEQQSLFGRVKTQTTCPVCNGTGKEIKNKCHKCHGEGKVKTQKTVEVNVPAGIETGQQIRLAGYGNKGSNGGPNGDLYILFEVKKDSLFERQGDDVIINMPITFSQAALGADIQVPTPYGDVKLKIPAGTQSETIFRLRDKGIPNVRTKRKGSEHVIIKVVTPTKLSSDQKKLFDKLSKTNEKTSSKLFDKIKNHSKK